MVPLIVSADDQRQVTENMSIGRRFSMRGRTFFEIRAEFFNVLNRTYLRVPTDFNNNPLSTRIQLQG